MPDVITEYAETLKAMAESPTPLCLVKVDGQALMEAGFAEVVSHERWTGTRYRLTAAGFAAVESLGGKVHPIHEAVR